jgi:ABC-type transporter Mla subunit MlaD
MTTLRTSERLNELLEKPMPSRFAEVAAKLKAEKAKLLASVEDLDKDIDKFATDGNDAISQHRAAVAELASGVKELAEAARDLMGNDEEGENKTVATFHPKTGTDGR